MRLVVVFMMLIVTSFSKSKLPGFSIEAHDVPIIKTDQPDSLEIARKVLYQLHPKELDVENVYHFLSAGFAENTKPGHHEKEYNYRLLLARAYIVKDQSGKAGEYLLPLINELKKDGKTKEEAKAYLDFAMVYSGKSDDDISARPFQEDMGSKMLKYLNLALLLARQQKDNDLQFQALRQITFYYFYYSNRVTGNHHGADSVANLLLNFCKKNDVEQLYLPYTVLMQTSKNNYAFPEALNYGLQAVASGKQFHHDAELIPVYFSLAELYYNTNRNQEALDAYENLIATAKRYHKPISVLIAPAYSNLLLKFKMGEKALQFLHSFNPDTIPSVYLRYNYYLSLAALNFHLDKYEDAEKYYLLAKSQTKDQDTLVKIKANLDLGRLFVTWEKYEKARPYVQLTVDPTIKNVPIKNLSLAQLLLFKIDSAAKKYTSAIQHLVLHDNYDAKYIDQQNHKALDEIQVKYKTAEKEKDIQLLQSEMKLSDEKIKLSHETLLKNEKKVAYLNVQNQLQNSETEKKKKDIALKNQRIKLLTQSNDYQRLSISKAGFEKRMTVGGIVLMSVIMVLLFYQFNIKRKASNSINQKNILLQQLVTDKELLMKEVHHRVKNNLQTITSLLETQSSYLDNSIALEAISESQSRIKAIALIHHRLYSETHLAIIEMAPYIQELVQYLKDTYDTIGRGITFIIQIDTMNLDVQQAVPVALILNEAVTNAIKYAFSDKRKGEITIQLTAVNNLDIVFKVQDDGVGLPRDQARQNSTSMGMGLITGLSKQLKGSLDIVSNKGTMIRVVFKKLN